MNRDIRLDVDFWDHPKTIRLQREFGLRGVEYIQRIWLYAAKYHPTGILEGDDPEDLSVVAHFDGNALEFVSKLVELRWIDSDESPHFSLHNWEKRNPWACKAEERTIIARNAANSMHLKRLIKISDAPSMHQACTEHAEINKEHMHQACTEHAPSPFLTKKKELRAREDSKSKKRNKYVKLPEYISSDLWKQFKNHRKTLRSPMSEHAEMLAFQNLERLREAGSDPVRVVLRSIEMGWKGLFELPPEQREKPKPKTSEPKSEPWFPDLSGIYDANGELLPRKDPTAAN